MGGNMKKRVVMLSGANRGIGLAIAKALYEEGYYGSLPFLVGPFMHKFRTLVSQEGSSAHL